MISENVFDADNHAGKAQYSFLEQKYMAYLFGVYLGDGCCNKAGRHYNFRIVSEDDDVVRKTMKIVNKMFNRHYKIIFKKPNKTRLSCLSVYSDKVMFNLLREVTLNKSKIPEFVKNSSSVIKAEFVAGLMDTDGYASQGINKFGQQRFSLGFVNSSKWIDEFIDFLTRLKVKVGKKTLKKKYRSLNEKDCYQININLRSFVEAGLYFSCKRKQRILDNYLSNVRYQSY